MKNVKNFAKCGLSVFLSLMLVISLLPTAAFAADDVAEEETGTIDTNKVVIDVTPSEGDDDAGDDAEPEATETTLPGDIDSVSSANRPHVTVDAGQGDKVSYDGTDDNGYGIKLEGGESSTPNPNNATTATSDNRLTQASGTIEGSETATGDASYDGKEGLIEVEPEEDEYPEDPEDETKELLDGTVGDDNVDDEDGIKVTLNGGEVNFDLLDADVQAALAEAISDKYNELLSDEAVADAAPEGYAPNEQGVYAMSSVEGDTEINSVWEYSVSEPVNGVITVTEVTTTTEITEIDAPVDWEPPVGANVNPDGDGYSITTYNMDGSWVVATTTFSNGKMTTTKLTILVATTEYELTVETESGSVELTGGKGSTGVNENGVANGATTGWTEIQPDFNGLGFQKDSNGNYLQNGASINGVTIGWQNTKANDRPFGNEGAYGNSVNITQGYDYYYNKANGTGLASLIAAGTSKGANAHQFAVYDRSGNVHYVYCSDSVVNPTYSEKGIDYSGKQLLDGSRKDVFYSNLNQYQAQLNYIAANGYWGAVNGSENDFAATAGSLDAFKQWLRSIDTEGTLNGCIDSVTDGIALTVTQAVIWSYAKSTGSGNGRTDNFTEYTFAGTSGVTNENTKIAKAIYDFLVGTDGKGGYLNNPKSDLSTKLSEKDYVTVSDVQNISVTVKDSNTVGDVTTNTADIVFTLDVNPSKLNDDLLVVVKGADGTAIKSYRLTGANSLERSGQTYTISNIPLPNGEFTLHLEGTQINEKRAYVIVAEGGYTESQSFIGAEVQNRVYALDIALNLAVSEASATLTTTADVDAQKFEQFTKEWSGEWETLFAYDEPSYSNSEGDDDDDDGDDDDTPEIPENPTPEEEIPEDPTPLSPAQEDEELPEDDVPLAEIPEEEEELPEDPVPLADVPATGDISYSWYAMTGFAALGLVFLTISKKREQEG